MPRSQRENLRLLVCQQIWRASRSPSSPTRRAALLPSHPPYKPPDPQRSHWHVLWYSPILCSSSGVHLLPFRFAIWHAQFGCSSPQIAARLSFRPLITYSYKPGLALESGRAPKLRLATSGPTFAAARNSLDYRMPLERLTPAPSGYPLRVQVIAGRMPALIDCTLEDRGRLFRAVLKHFLAPLRVLRGVDLKYDGLFKFGSHRLYYSRIIGDSQRSWEEALRVFAGLERIRMSFLHGLAERVSQHT